MINYTQVYLTNYNNINSRQTQYNIILDIDETLIHTKLSIDISKDERISNDPVLSNRVYKTYFTTTFGSVLFCSGTKRPYMKEFIAYCFNKFDKVIIWSAGCYGYVHKMVDIIFRDTIRPHIIYTSNDLTIHEDGNFYKDVNKLFNEFDDLNMDNCFFIDDRKANVETCSDIGVVIPEYHPKLHNEYYDDNKLVLLMDWFDENLNGTINVSDMEIDNIF